MAGHGVNRRAHESIKADTDVLKQELAKEARRKKLTMDMTPSQVQEMHELQKRAEHYIQKIEHERNKVVHMDKEIADLQKQLISQGQHVGGPAASKENHDLIAKQIRLLENRLDKALVKFNQKLADNKQLREQIDSLRRERVVFDAIYKKLERELFEKKKEMSAIIEDSKNAYQARDKAQSEIASLKQQVDKEKAEFEREWRELGGVMDEERQLREARRRRGVELLGAKNQRASGSGPAAEQGGSMRAGAHADAARWAGEKDKAHGLIMQKLGTENEKSSLESQYGSIQHEEAFAQIQESTGITSINEFVDKFMQVEDKNFSLFNFVNDLNSEIERLEQMIADTKTEVEKFKGQGVSGETQRKKLLRELEERLARTGDKADEYDAKYQNAGRIIAQLKSGIASIFSRLGCASTSVEEMLGGQGVTESNMMQYLAIIEQRASEILQTYAASDSSSSHAAEGIPTTLTEVLPVGACRVSVHPPAWEDFSSGESDQEDGERPLTRDELSRETLRRLGKKGGRGPAAKRK